MSLSDGSRGSGRTTRQIREAPFGATFVCCTQQAVLYTKHLAARLGRDDLRVTGPFAIEPERLRGIEAGRLVIDHATRLSGGQFTILVELDRRAGLFPASTKPQSCAECHDSNLANWYTSKRDGRTLCEACFKNREGKQLAKEVEAEPVQRHGWQPKYGHPLDKL